MLLLCKRKHAVIQSTDYLICQFSYQSKMIESCQSRLVNLWNTFSGCFPRWLSCSTVPTSPSLAILSFLWRCISVGVERSEFMHMHFVLHSCLNLEPFGDQLQPSLNKERVGCSVTCPADGHRRLQLCLEGLVILSWQCRLYNLFFSKPSIIFVFVLKIKAIISAKLWWTGNLSWGRYVCQSHKWLEFHNCL